MSAHVLGRTTDLVIDGRQRLQTLSGGLMGTVRGSVLQLDLLSDEDQAFQLAPESAGSVAGEAESAALRYSVPALFARLRTARDERQVSREIATHAGVADTAMADRIAGNVRRFRAAFLEDEAIAVCVVTADHTRREREQARIVELFRRLHRGASPLPASTLEELNAVRIADVAAPQPADSVSPMEHPILADRTSWQSVFAVTGSRELWTDRYVAELRRNRIETVADFARWIMLCGIAVRKKQRQGAVYRFHTPSAEGFLPNLAITEFGGWAWKVALLELADRGFDWLEYVVG